jgi:hypothetical protein
MAARYASDDVSADALAEIRLVGVTAKITKRQDGNGGTLRPREMRLAPHRDSVFGLRGIDSKDPNWPADVFELAFSKVSEADCHLVPNVVANRTCDDDLAWFREWQDACSDVDAISDHCLLVNDDILDVDRNPQRQVRQSVPCGTLRHAVLRFERPCHCVHDARKFDQDIVTGGLLDMAATLSELWLQHFGAQQLPGAQCFEIVALDMTAPAHHIRKCNGRQPPGDRGHLFHTTPILACCGSPTGSQVYS